MLVLFTNNKPSDFLISIRQMIREKNITTWTFSALSSRGYRYDWTGGNKNNWKNLTKDVYFTASVNSENYEDDHITFKLHTKRGHFLEDADYAVMHSELLQMLFAHLYKDIALCLTAPAKRKMHKADVLDSAQ